MTCADAPGAGSMSELQPHRWRAWGIDFASRRPGRLQLRRVVLHIAEAASFAWDLAGLPQVTSTFLVKLRQNYAALPVCRFVISSVLKA